jgi:hypothetical protein
LDFATPTFVHVKNGHLKKVQSTVKFYGFSQVTSGEEKFQLQENVLTGDNQIF